MSITKINHADALKAFRDPSTDKELLRERLVKTIKVQLKGDKVFITDGSVEDSTGKKVVGVDAVRIYHPGRSNSTKLDDITLEDALEILSLISKY